MRPGAPRCARRRTHAHARAAREAGEASCAHARDDGERLQVQPLHHARQQLRKPLRRKDGLQVLLRRAGSARRAAVRQPAAGMRGPPSTRVRRTQGREAGCGGVPAGGGRTHLWNRGCELEARGICRQLKEAWAALPVRLQLRRQRAATGGQEEQQRGGAEAWQQQGGAAAAAGLRAAGCGAAEGPITFSTTSRGACGARRALQAATLGASTGRGTRPAAGPSSRLQADLHLDAAAPGSHTVASPRAPPMSWKSPNKLLVVSQALSGCSRVQA